MNKKEFIKSLQNKNIFCINSTQKQSVCDILEKLGLYYDNDDKTTRIESDSYITIMADYSGYYIDNLVSYFRSRLDYPDFIKQYNLIKDEPKLEPYEARKDGIIIKINDYKSYEVVYYIDIDTEYLIKDFEIERLSVSFIDNLIKYGFLATNKEILEHKLEKMQVETMLENIAEELNNGEVIDWNNRSQEKYNIYYDKIHNNFEYLENTECKTQGSIYCLSYTFCVDVVNKIGKERLINYFKNL